MGIRERKERERLKRANDILEAARRVFEKRGFLNTTLQHVAKEAEVSVGLIYRYFDSKEDIFAALALKGAEQFDVRVAEILGETCLQRPADDVLIEIAMCFFEFYQPYGEYFDRLMYSLQGKKQVNLKGETVTDLIRLTLLTMERLKEFIRLSPEVRASTEEEALNAVLLMWSILLGCHKLFEASGRGHLFALSQADFLRGLLSQLMIGIALPKAEKKRRPTTDTKLGEPAHGDASESLTKDLIGRVVPPSLA